MNRIYFKYKSRATLLDEIIIKLTKVINTYNDLSLHKSIKMNMILFASLLVLSINQSFACECGSTLGRPFETNKYERKLSRFQWFTNVIGKDNNLCGSVLIDDKHVATSAHCVAGLKAEALKVKLNDKSEKSVSSVWVDRRYDEATGSHDFAILTLSSPVDSQFTPICLLKDYAGIEALRIRISPKLNSSVETKYFDDFAEGECEIPVANTQICTALNAEDGTEIYDCDEAVFTARPYNRAHYLVGFPSKCQKAPSLSLYTDALKYNGIIKKLAPNSCFKPYY